MMRRFTMRMDDVPFGILSDISNSQGMSINEFINDILVDKLSSIPALSKNIALLHHGKTLRHYKSKRRSLNELRYEIFNVMDRIYYGILKCLHNNLPINYIQINSQVDEFEGLWMTYPQELLIELKSEHDLLLSLKHKTSLSEYIKNRRIENFGRQNVKARKRIEHKTIR